MAPKSVPPDVAGTKIVPGGYLQYPKQLVKSVPETPARSGEITITKIIDGPIIRFPGAVKSPRQNYTE